jgi:predicted transcriptional regulator
LCFFKSARGTILLGVQDSREVTGIDPGAIGQMKKDFVTAINNPQKLHPPACLSVDEMTLDGKSILRIYIPQSSQVHRCNGRIYDRNEDGDLDITDNTRQVADLYQRKQATYSENKIYPYAGLDELEHELLAKCRKIAVLRREDHPWRNMDDMELLKSAQLYQTDPETGKSGVTLAGLLLLGKRSPLLSAVPHHRTDLILRKVMRYGKVYGGANPALIEGDIFKIVVKVPEFGTLGEITHQAPSKHPASNRQVTHQVKRLIETIREEMARTDLMNALSLKDRVNFARNYLEPALTQGLIEMTQPESPQSPTQKYRLTEKGRKVLEMGNTGSAW